MNNGTWTKASEVALCGGEAATSLAKAEGSSKIGAKLWPGRKRNKRLAKAKRRERKKKKTGGVWKSVGETGRPGRRKKNLMALKPKNKRGGDMTSKKPAEEKRRRRSNPSKWREESEEEEEEEEPQALA